MHDGATVAEAPKGMQQWQCRTGALQQVWGQGETLALPGVPVTTGVVRDDSLH